MRTGGTLAVLVAVAALALSGCSSDEPSTEPSNEEAFIADVREGAPDNTEDDLTLLTNADYICDSFADAESVAEIVDLLDTYDGDTPGQHTFNVVYFRAATTHLCPDVREDYETALDLQEDGTLN